MALNPNIILQGQPPPLTQPDPMEQYGKALSLKSLLTQGQVQQQALEDDKAQRDAFAQSGGDSAAYLKALAAGGNYKAYQAAQQQQLASQKTQAELGKTQAETQKTQGDVTNQAIARHRDQLAGVNDPQSAAQWLTAGYNDPVAGKVLQQTMPLDQALQRIPTDPMLFQQWKQQAALGATKYIEMNKPTYQTRNTGGQTDTIALPGLGGPASVVNSIKNTQSPDSIASNATTMRGQNMVDARQRETNAANMSKPFEVTAQDGTKVLVQQDKQGNITPVQGYLPKTSAPKPLTEQQSNAALYGSRMDTSGKIIDDLSAQGINKSIPGSRLPVIGQLVNALSPGDFQKLDQAKRDFINATLRRESGAAIAQSEFDNAEKQYFPQPGDKKDVIEQKRQNRAIATRGILAAVPGDQRTGLVNEITGGQKQGMATPIKTADDYAKLPSGATYVDPQGQTRRKP